MSETAPATKPGKAARNESRKAFSATLNGLSVGGLVAVFVQSLLGQLNLYILVGTGVAFVVAQYALDYVLGRLED